MLERILGLSANTFFVAKTIVLALVGILLVPLYVLVFRDNFRKFPRWAQALTLPVLLVSGRLLKFFFKSAGDSGFF